MLPKCYNFEMQASRWVVGGGIFIILLATGWFFWPRASQTGHGKPSGQPQAQATTAATHQQTTATGPGGNSAATAPTRAPSRPAAQVAYAPAASAPAAPAGAPAAGTTRPRNWAPGGNHPLDPSQAPPREVAPWKNKSGTAAPIRRRKKEDQKKHVASEARQKRLDNLKSKMSGKRLEAFDRRASYLEKLKENKKQ